VTRSGGRLSSRSHPATCSRTVTALRGLRWVGYLNPAGGFCYEPRSTPMIVVRLMGALLTPKQPRFYTGRHRARLRPRPVK